MRNYEFNAAKTKNEIVEWIRNYFRKNGSDCNAVIGISGGKDSSIVAALCCEAPADAHECSGHCEDCAYAGKNCWVLGPGQSIVLKEH